MLNAIGRPAWLPAVKFDSCNNLLSSVHTGSPFKSRVLDVALTVNVLVKHPKSGFPPTVLYNLSYLQLQSKALGFFDTKPYITCYLIFHCETRAPYSLGPRFRHVYQGARWSSGIDAAIGARGRGSRPVHYLTVQRPWTSRQPLNVCSLDKRLSGCWRLIRLL